jgi:hypothetical protein
MMPGKPKKLTREQLARAQALVDAGYKVQDVAARFGVKTSQLNRYGVRRRPAHARKENHAETRDGR